MVSENFEKIFLTFLGLGTNVVKVGSVNSELLFQWDTLTKGAPPVQFGKVYTYSTIVSKVVEAPKFRQTLFATCTRMVVA